MLCSMAQVRFNEERSSFTTFLTSLCAIIGGVFTVSGLVDAFIYHGQQVCLSLHTLRDPGFDRNFRRVWAAPCFYAV